MTFVVAEDEKNVSCHKHLQFSLIFSLLLRQTFLEKCQIISSRPNPAKLPLKAAGGTVGLIATELLLSRNNNKYYMFMILQIFHGYNFKELLFLILFYVCTEIKELHIR